MDKSIGGDAVSGARERQGPGYRRAAAFLADQAPILVLVVLCVLTALMQPRFLSPINLTNILLQASVMAVVVIGMTYVIISGGFDLSVGSTVAASGCAATAAMLLFAPDPLGPADPAGEWVAVSIGVAAGISAGLLVGLMNGVLVAYVGLNAFIATLGTMVLVRGLTLLTTDAQPVTGEIGLPNLFVDLGRERFLGIPLITWTPLALIGFCGWLLHRTAFGLRMFAVGGGSEAAFLAGIRTRRVKALAYVWCGGLAGVGGVLLAARLQSGQPTAGAFYELFAIAAVILGGASLYGGEGKLWRSIVGLMIIVVLANSLNILNVASHWQEVAIGLVIIVAASIHQLRRGRS